MIRAVFRARLTRAFAAINRGDYGPVLAAFAPDCRHVFYGAHALGGVRTTDAERRAWYGRLQRIFPDLRFEIEAIAMSGPPWAVLAAVVWRDRFTVNSETEGNQGVHVLRFRGTRVAELAIHCDTQKLARILERRARDGVADALAAPIGAMAG